MEQSKNYNHVQYNSVEPGNEKLEPSSQGFMLDPANYINANIRPPELNISEAKPVLNYSIQTGEEFALEFMRDRVNTRKPFIPNTAGDPNYTYSELKGILGITHTGSESGSDISMLTIVEKGSKEFEWKNSSLYEDKHNYGSVQSVPRTSSDYNSNRGIVHAHASSGASDSSSTKIKILCSFGGKILPRPSDGKLRYVGGETRIIRMSKDISWQELWQKTITIYDQTHTIKYQLPGEDLDALVSVSCDEDLQNMMEECNVLEDGEGPKKLRMFLFSVSDLDDTHFGFGNPNGDSEIQFVVAVNGMDMGSRKNSTLHGRASSSGNNLDELDGQNVERDASRVSTDFIGVSTSPLTGFVVSSSTAQYSQTILPSSSNAYETYSQFLNDQMMHHGEAKQHPLHYGYDFHPSNCSPFGESSVPLSVDELMTQQGRVTEMQPSSGLYTQDPQMKVKEVKLNSDGSVQQEGECENIQPSKNDYLVPSQPHDDSLMDYFPVKEGSAVIPTIEGEFPSKPSKEEGRHQEPVRVPSPVNAVNPVQFPKSSDNECHTSGSAFAPGYANSESDPTDLSCLEPPVPPQRVFYSERIPREQAELLNRLSKSDDSLGSQFLMNHSRPDIAQQEDFVTESVEKLHNGNLALQTEQAISTAKPLLVDPQNSADGLVQLQKLKQAVPNPVDDKYAINEDRILRVDHETTCAKDNNKDLLVDETSEAGSKIPAGRQLASVNHIEDPAHNLPELHWGVRSDSNSTANSSPGHAQPSACMGSSTGDVSQVEPSVGVSRTERGDILIDINDRFPRDFLFDIFSKEILSEDLSGISLLQKDGAGLSLNIENHEPQHWSFFQKLARDEFARKDVSLIDQDHLGFSSGLPKVEEEAPMSYTFTPLPSDGISVSHVDSEINFGEDDQKELPGTIGADTVALHSDYNPSQVMGNEGMRFDGLAENLRTPDSEYEDGLWNIGLPPLDPSLGDFDISTLQIIKNEDLEELRELGSGTYGTVYHGKWRGTDVAIKRIKKSCFTGRSSEQERLIIEFWREAEILSKLHHPNVLAFYGVVQDGPGGTLATVAEYMVDGSLRHVLLRKDRHLDRRRRLIIAMDAAFGMEYLHSKNIVHFDLKCDNLLVNLKDPSRPICKVGDFGLSKIKRNTLVSGGVRGTLPWMAPELLNGSSNKVSEKVDVFSFGIVLWEILTGEEPYANMHYGAIIGGIVSNTLRPSIPSFCDPEWRRLMEQCWAPNPAARPSFTEIASRLRVMSAASQAKTHGHKASN
uniref:Protein kinase domain-containing protein n=1 Tax=Davidia involucrata TaxID=16924 RepID=A0A5B7BBL6_DAVIN